MHPRVVGCFLFLVVCAWSVSAKVDESLLTDDFKKLMATLHKTCVDQTGVNEALVEKLGTGEFEDDAKLKCYVKCVMKESGTMGDDGKIDMTSFNEVIPEKLKEIYKDIFETCVKKEEGTADHCEKAHAILKCVHDQDSDDFFFV